MSEFEVTCITKPDRENRHEHITHIGNNSSNWCMSRENVVQRIESKSEAFYTTDHRTGKKAYIGVVREAGKLPYLRTYSDGAWNNNLLALPECSGCKIVN